MLTGVEKNSFSVAAADFNNDGHLDAYFGNAGKNRLCEGDGTGSFTCAETTESKSSRAVAAGDLNKDGKADVVIGNNNKRNRACLGNGDLTFSCSDVGTVGRRTRGLALGDFNNDGYLDILSVNQNQNGRICLNDGSGGFPRSSVRKCAGQRQRARSGSGRF